VVLRCWSSVYYRGQTVEYGYNVDGSAPALTDSIYRHANSTPSPLSGSLTPSADVSKKSALTMAGGLSSETRYPTDAPDDYSTQSDHYTTHRNGYRISDRLRLDRGDQFNASHRNDRRQCALSFATTRRRPRRRSKQPQHRIGLRVDNRLAKTIATTTNNTGRPAHQANLSRFLPCAPRRLRLGSASLIRRRPAATQSDASSKRSEYGYERQRPDACPPRSLRRRRDDNHCPRWHHPRRPANSGGTRP